MPTAAPIPTRAPGGHGPQDRPVEVAVRRRAALSGVLAASLTLGVAQLVAGFLSPASAPLVAIGDGFIDVVPGWLKEVAIAAFGVHDKTALLTGMVVVLAVLAVLIGLLAGRSSTAGTLAVVALGAAGAAAAATRPDAGTLAVVPSLLGALAGAAALRALIRRSQEWATDQVCEDAGAALALGPDRRSFLTAAGLVAAGAVLAAAAGSVVGTAGRVAVAARDRLHLPWPAHPAGPVPDGAQSPVAGVVDVVTPNAEFYRIDTALTVPRVDPTTWSLRVHGLVAREVNLSFEDLLAENLVEAYLTLACVSNPVGGDLVGNARWLGLPVRDLLARAGPQPGADMVLSTSADGFTASTPLRALTDDRDALIAVGMNGQPLPLEHGFPVRMVVPGLYGYVSATKWLTDLEVTRFAERSAYWTQRGWSAKGPVKTASRIEVPRSGAVVDAGRVDVGGTAWAQHRGIRGVEVQVDEEPWQQVDLRREISVDTWRQWSWRWEAAPGEHVLRVRASDPVGTQTGRQAPVAPDGATGWHQVRVTVRST